MRHIFGAPDERMFRKMGYFSDQSGIIKRYSREQRHWDEHLHHTKQMAVQAIKGKGRGAAAVLGSGWLLDVPVEELSHSFETVSLLDVRHPSAARKSVQQYKNVKLCVCDISGFARATYHYAKQYRNRKQRLPINTIQPQFELDLNDFDYIFSCNILNQLDILLIDYLSKFFTLSDEETIAFRRHVQQQHIDGLPPGKSCLVTDYEEIIYSGAGEEIQRRTLIYNPLIHRQDAQRWRWEFDTHMTYYDGRKTFFNVLSLNI